MQLNQESPTIQFETIPDDPKAVQIYTLSNGLRLYLSVNDAIPRIFTNIAVRAGSKHDPPDTTGLAHYLEHLLFKGTDQIGALNWPTEVALLQQIADLYEAHRTAPSQSERDQLYLQIDQLSQQAAQWVAANEYDLLASAIGAQQTNAYTWVEQTVFVNNIPSNELERWMELESERFKKLVLRLFHTELETVYEEFNISQDKDFRKVSAAMNETLFPSHPYGLWTTLGKGEHLKRPSHYKIQQFFQTHYVPNNMALILAGDFDPVMAVQLAEKYFGHYQPQTLPTFQAPAQPPLEQPIHREVWGQEAAYVEIGWRFPGAAWEQMPTLDLLTALLYNKKAGLIDLNLNKAQRVLGASARLIKMEDYSVLRLYGKPQQGQSLEEVEQLLLEQIDLLRKGEFEDWLLEAVVNEFRLEDLKSVESNDMRAYLMTSSFILDVPWERIARFVDYLERVDHPHLVDFARQFLRDNYVCVHKKTGPDPNVLKVEKPALTPVQLNREQHSDFARQFLNKETDPITPEFINFSEKIQGGELACGLPFAYIENDKTPLFSLDYLYRIGRKQDPAYSLALGFLSYLGTQKYSASKLQQELFRLGLNMDFSTNLKRSYLHLSGLEKNLEDGLALFEHFLQEVQPDQQAMQRYVQAVLSNRSNKLKDKHSILHQAMTNFAQYGPENPFTHLVPKDQLLQMQPDTLLEAFRKVQPYQHEVFYFGQKPAAEAQQILETQHLVSGKLPAPPQGTPFKERQLTEPEVFLVDFPMVQVEVLFLSKGTQGFDLDEFILAEWYNTYFGSGLSSIVFQEIREAKALAYSTYAQFTSPREQEESHYLKAFLGTQPDKLKLAVSSLHHILEEMPIFERQMENARQSVIRKIESHRLLNSSIFWTQLLNQQRGYDRDLRRDIYERLQSAHPADLIRFHQEKIRERTYSLLVIGNKQHLDLDFLGNFGKIRELSLHEIFGFDS